MAANISLRSRKVAKEEKENKIKKDYQKKGLTQSLYEKESEIEKKFIKTFLKNLGKRDLKNKDYEDFLEL